MKKAIITLFFLLICIVANSAPIKSLSENILNSCLANLQVQDSALNGDVPKISLLKTGNYGWNISWKTGANGNGSLVIPVGAVADITDMKINYKVTSKTGDVSLKFVGRYNRKSEFADYYLGLMHAKPVMPLEYLFNNNDLTTDQIKTVTVKNPRWAKDNYGFMQAVSLEFAGQGNINLELYSIELINSKNEVFDVFSYDWDMRSFELPPYITKGKIPTGKNTIYIGMSSLEAACDEGRKRILRLKELVPNLGCDGCDYAAALMYYKDFYIKNNIPAYYQFGGSCNIEPVVSENKAHFENAAGNSRDKNPGTGSHNHEFDWTSSVVKDAFKKEITLCAKTGIPEFQFIDAIWCVYPEDIDWGYGDTTINNFKKDLLEEDNGLLIGKYTQKGKRVKFHEFLKESSGIDIKPNDLGLKSWNEYIPCLNGFSTVDAQNAWKAKTGVTFSAKRYFLHIMLKHYEWLKLFSELGEVGKPIGTDIVSMPNGNNWGNANDYSGLMSLSTVKVLIDETRFYLPYPVIKGYSELPTWHSLIKKYEKHHRLICEVGLGGGANIYLDSDFSYIMNYALQSVGHYDSMQVDWVSGAVNENSDKYGTEAWVDFLFKSWGYNDATKDNPKRIDNYKKAVRLITPVCNSVEISQKSSFDRPLSRSTNPFSLMDYREWNMLNYSKKANLLIVDTMNIPQETADNISNTILKRKMNVLFHSYVAGAVSDGLNYTNFWYPGNTINKPDLYGKILGNVSLEGNVNFNGKVDGANNLKINYTGEYYNISKKAETILSINNKPLLSLITLSNGSKAYYYHINAGTKGTEDIDNFVLAKIYKDSNIPNEGSTDNAWLQRFKLPNGAESIMVFNQKSFDDFNGPPGKWAFFDYDAKGAKASVKFDTLVTGEYVLYDFMAEKIIANSSAPTVSIDLIDKSSGIFYVIPKAKSTSFIKELKARRDKLIYWNKYCETRFGKK